MEPTKLDKSDVREVLGLNTHSGGRANLKRFAFWGILAGVVVVALIFWATRSSSETFSYKTSRAVQGDLTMIVGATGNIEPTNQVDVGSELSGIIESVAVDFNDHVDKGQVLARLDTDRLEADVKKSIAALESARAEVLQAEATLKQTRSELNRLRQVHDASGGKVPSAFSLEVAEATYARAQAELAGAQAQAEQATALLEYARTDLAKALIRSPISGIVLSRNVDPGQTVAASLQAPVLFTLAENLARMELHVDVDEADVGQVRENQEATFTVDAYPDRVFHARITQVRYAASITDGVVTYETILTVDNEGLLLRPGMTATADITVARVENATLVPNAALRFSPRETEPSTPEKSSSERSFTSRLFPRPPGRSKAPSNHEPARHMSKRQQVWILEGGRPVPVTVTAGLSDGIMTEIISDGITPGMELIIGTMTAKK
ncbi:MAG: efflux RND transporter periplasmic adaptor subunit [Desulfomonilia bacterium]|nr:efflux RND transporter periplasmic adaptor subunit [Desulfomonilia bacterium]